MPNLLTKIFSRRGRSLASSSDENKALDPNRKQRKKLSSKEKKLSKKERKALEKKKSNGAFMPQTGVSHSSSGDYPSSSFSRDYSSSHDDVIRKASFETSSRPQSQPLSELNANLRFDEQTQRRNPKSPVISPDSQQFFEATFPAFEYDDAIHQTTNRKSSPPTLQYNNVQKLEKEMTKQKYEPFNPYDPNPSKKSNLSRLPNGQLIAADLRSPSSMVSDFDFDLSTDVEDNDYNQMRQYGEFVPTMLNKNSFSPSSEDDLSPHRFIDTSKPNPINQQHRNTSYFSNDSASEIEEPEVNNNPDVSHYFSDSENSTPVKYTFPHQFEAANKIEQKKSIESDLSSPPNKQQKNDLSPRTLAIKQAQELENQGVSAHFNSSNSDPITKKSTTGNVIDFGDNKNFPHASTTQRASKSVAGPTVSDLLAQARARRNDRISSASVNSAPVDNANYLRQHHNLPSKPSSNANSKARPEDSNSATAAKEKLRRRRKEIEEMKKSQSGNQESDDSDKGEDINESWLFDEVTGALGPRGIAADLESLGGRSNLSRTSNGNKSHRSHRSHRSQKSSKRRSDESVGSRHSRASRASRVSTRSQLSQMSEQSRSVANDLLRLEMQLAMVGNNRMNSSLKQNGPGSSTVSSSGDKYTSKTTSLSRRVKLTVVAPPGKLGIILANKTDSKGTVVSGVRMCSVLTEKISPGDRIIAIDGEDVSRMNVSEITAIMTRKNDFERVLTILSTAKNQASDTISNANSSQIDSNMESNGRW